MATQSEEHAASPPTGDEEDPTTLSLDEADAELEPDDGSATGERMAVVLLFLLALAVGTAIRFWNLGGPTLWVDEANAYLTAKESLPTILSRLETDSSPPLYYFLLHNWSALFGSSEVALRSLSVIFGVATIALVFFLARTVFSSRVAVWASFIVATSPVHILYSQQVRMYSLLPLLATASVFLLVRSAQTYRKGYLAAYVVVTALALYTHNFALWLLPAHLVLLLWRGDLWKRPVPWLVAFAAVALAYAPWIPTLSRQVANPDHYAWFAEFWNAWGTFVPVLFTLDSFSPAGAHLGFTSLEPRAHYGIIPLTFAALALLGLWRNFRTKGGLRSLEAAWVPVLLFVPALCALAFSALSTPNYVPGRVDQMLFPAFAILVALGLCALPFQPLRVVLGLGLCVIGLVRAGVLHPSYGSRWLDGNDRDLARAISEEVGPDDVVVFTSLTRAPVEYYLEREGKSPRMLSYPRDSANHLGSQNDWRLMKSPQYMVEEARQVVGELQATRSAGGKAFVLMAYHPVNLPLVYTIEQSLDTDEDDRAGDFKQSGTNSITHLYRFEPEVPAAEEGEG